MWHTEQGDRVLSGAEARAFAEGLLDLIEFRLSADTDYLGEDVFVDLPPGRARALKEEMGVANGYFPVRCAGSQDGPGRTLAC